jgi:hypothetical protein
MHNSHFADVSEEAGPAVSEPSASRGCAFGDFDNDGDIDFVINCERRAAAGALRFNAEHSWIRCHIGTRINHSGIGFGCVMAQIPKQAAFSNR